MHFLALFTVFGGALFAVAIRRDTSRDDRLSRLASIVACVSGLAWLACTIAYATGGFDTLLDPAMLRVFFIETPFGSPMVVRLVLLTGLFASAVAPLGQRLRVATTLPLSAALLVSQAWLGHAAEGGDTPLGAAMIATYAVHVLAGAAWVGGLPALVLAIVQARGRPDAILGLLQRYSIIAIGAVGLVLVSGVANTLFHLEGSLASIAESAYGRVLAVKLGIVATMLGLAAFNRFILMPRLRDGGSNAVLGPLRWSLALETGLAILLLGAAALLGITPPPQ